MCTCMCVRTRVPVYTCANGACGQCARHVACAVGQIREDGGPSLASLSIVICSIVPQNYLHWQEVRALPVSTKTILLFLTMVTPSPACCGDLAPPLRLCLRAYFSDQIVASGISPGPSTHAHCKVGRCTPIFSLLVAKCCCWRGLRQQGVSSVGILS